MAFTFFRWERAGRDMKNKDEELTFDDLELGDPVKGGLEM